MQPRSNPTSSSWPAATLIETLVFIAILVLTAGMSYQILAFSGLFGDRQSAQLRKTSALLAFEDQAPLVLGRVAPVGWSLSSAVFSKEGSTLVVRGFDGDNQQMLRIDADRTGYLRFGAQGLDLTWGPFDVVAVDYWTNRDRPIGLKVTLSLGGVKTVVHLPWGGQVL